jgi:hypothetical protein
MQMQSPFMVPAEPAAAAAMDPMDIDPIDGGPKPQPMNSTKSSGYTSLPSPSTTTTTIIVGKEEDARQAIEMLRGDDVSARVAAAHRLDLVANVLGPERTRDVRV